MNLLCYQISKVKRKEKCRWAAGAAAEMEAVMNNQYLLHTPEGVRDIYGAEYARKETVQKRIAQVMKLYGYRNNPDADV